MKKITVMLMTMFAFGCVGEVSEVGQELDPLELERLEFERLEAEAQFTEAIDPCRAESATSCGETGVCVWLDRGVDACVAAFGILMNEDSALQMTEEPLLVLSERVATLSEIREEPLTQAEFAIAAEQAEDVYYSIMQKEGLLTGNENERLHNSSYCGRRMSGYRNVTIWKYDYSICPYVGCRMSMYYHYSRSWSIRFGLTYEHRQSRAC